MTEPEPESETITLEAAVALNAHADKLFASLFSLTKSLPELSLAHTFKDLWSFVSDGKSTYDHPKFPHLPQDRVLELGRQLRDPYSVIRHLHNFYREAAQFLCGIHAAKRAVDFGWNYLFARASFILLGNAVRLSLFISTIPDADRVVGLYHYCYFRARGALPEDADALVKFMQTRSAPTTYEAELKQVIEPMAAMFKGIIVPLLRVVGATQGFEWTLVNLSDNPEPIPPGETFFRPEYLVMVDLDRLIIAFLTMTIIFPDYLNRDSQFLDLFQLVASQKTTLEFYGDKTMVLKHLFEPVKRRAKRTELELAGFFDAATHERVKKAREYRRRRLTMALNEALRAVETDFNTASLKLPIILALLGWANYEIASTLSSREGYDGKFTALVHAVVQLVGLMLKLQELIRRFALFNLREYHAPYIENLMNVYHFPHEAYGRMQTIVTGLQMVDIKEYDNGVRYDFSRLQLFVYQLVNYFTRYSESRGVLHLSLLFSQVSCLEFHMDSYTSAQTQVFNAAPIATYWRFRDCIEKMSKETRHYAAGRAYAFLSLCHYYVADRIAHQSWPGYRTFVEEHYKQLLVNTRQALVSWALALRKNLYADLTNQIVDGLRLTASTFGAADVITKEKSLLATPIGEESSNPLLRGLFKKSQDGHDQVHIFMRGLHDLGTIDLFGNPMKPGDAVLEGAKTLVSDLFKDMKGSESPASYIRQLDTARAIVRTVLSAGFIAPQPIIEPSVSALLEINLTESGGSLERVEGQHGIIGNRLEKFYTEFLHSKITHTYYSVTLQTFLPVPGFNLGFNAHSFLSRAALRTLVRLLGLPGLALIDILAADLAVALMEKLGEKIKNYTPLGDSVMPYVENPSLISDADSHLKVLTHIGAILRFRRLAREAAELGTVTEPRFAYLSPLTPPHGDIVLTSRLDKNPMMGVFNASTYPQFFGALFAQSYWANLVYKKADDAFLDNSHLLTDVNDALAACSIKKNEHYPLKTRYGEIIAAVRRGCLKGVEVVKAKKKKEYPYHMMLLVLDHLVKNSIYPDYALLESLIPYHYIRSIYTSVLMAPEGSLPE